jgi:hypothetical protein
MVCGDPNPANPCPRLPRLKDGSRAMQHGRKPATCSLGGSLAIPFTHNRRQSHIQPRIKHATWQIPYRHGREAWLTQLITGGKAGVLAAMQAA